MTASHHNEVALRFDIEISLIRPLLNYSDAFLEAFRDEINQNLIVTFEDRIPVEKMIDGPRLDLGLYLLIEGNYAFKFVNRLLFMCVTLSVIVLDFVDVIIVACPVHLKVLKEYLKFRELVVPTRAIYNIPQYD